MPLMLPSTRCALTAPFHPYRITLSRTESDKAVCFLLHWPWDFSPQALPGTLPYGARTFLPLNTLKSELKQRLPRLTLGALSLKEMENAILN